MKRRHGFPLPKHCACDECAIRYERRAELAALLMPPVKPRRVLQGLS